MVEDLDLVRLVKETLVNQRSLAYLLLSAVLACTAGCSRDNVPSAEASTPAPKPVAAAPAVPDYYETSGPLVVENQIDVLAQREGMVAQITAELGTRVQKGQLLAQLDDRQLQAQRDAAEAKIKTIEADVQTWEAEAKVLQNDYERDQEMFKASLITAKQLEHSRYKQIGSGYQLEGVRQQLKTAKAELRNLDLELEKTRITAPFAGVVARRYVRNGQRVALNDRLFWVTATEPINVQFTLPDTFLGKIASGSSVTVISQQSPELKATARVKAVSPVSDPASSTIEVLAELNGPTAGMTPGTTAVVRVARPK